MQELRVDDGTRIAYSDDGKGPTLIFVHGWSMTHHVWDLQIQHFRRSHRVIAPDLRGCGTSGARPGSHNMARYATDIQQLLTDLEVQDATLVGWSMGAGICAEYLERFGTDRVKTVGLVDFPPRLEEDPSVADKVCSALQTRRDSFLDSFMRRMVLDAERVDLTTHLRAQALQCRPEVACEMYRAMRVPGPASQDQFDVPAFLAFPANGWFPKALDAWKARFPAHVAPDFPRSRHCPFLEEPEDFNRGLESFLAADPGPRSR